MPIDSRQSLFLLILVTSESESVYFVWCTQKTKYDEDYADCHYYDTGLTFDVDDIHIYIYIYI